MPTVTAVTSGELRFTAKKAHCGARAVVTLKIPNGIKKWKLGRHVFYGHKHKSLKDNTIPRRIWRLRQAISSDRTLGRQVE